VELVGELGAAILGGRRHGGIFAGFRLLVLVGIGHVRFHALDVAGIFAFAGLLVVGGVLALAFAFTLLGRLVGVLAVLGLLALVGLLAVLGGIVEFALGHEVEIAEKGLRGLAELVLVLVELEQLFERGAALALDLVAPE